MTQSDAGHRAPKRPPVPLREIPEGEATEMVGPPMAPAAAFFNAPLFFAAGFFAARFVGFFALRFGARAFALRAAGFLADFLDAVFAFRVVFFFAILDTPRQNLRRHNILFVFHQKANS